eukprot:CAMPEP_0197536020 /NCGR_PEP_ID=MMETSP1318-20131121/52621_1 /TAXON_ID=552666 /ORGANISM="Partenskyella glossopodia, Strain RCC365" /LENGTH=250 /DNA_ID=CAMNT_0043093785 /DNA_START=56 /DNA_END=805 /DNA_ORIENTATION=+
MTLNLSPPLPKEVYRPTSLSKLPHSLYRLILAALSNLPNLFVVLLPYIVVLSAFIVFVVKNGGVAVGDKQNHVLALHLPQSLYFCFTAASLSAFWSLSAVGTQLNRYYREGFGGVFSVALASCMFVSACAAAAILVYKGTIVHPFLLADNRHFTFYIQRKLLDALRGLGKYIAVAFYVVSMWILGCQLSDETRSAACSKLRQLLLAGATAAVLTPSPLLEFRYFLTPFLIVYVHWIADASGPSAGSSSGW